MSIPVTSGQNVWFCSETLFFVLVNSKSYRNEVLSYIDATELMAAIYPPIWVRKGFGKSADTLWTCPGLPLAISVNFDFSILGHIFEDFRCILRFGVRCSRLAQLRCHRHCSWRPYITRFEFWEAFLSPWARNRLVLTLLRWFIITFFPASDALFLFRFRWDSAQRSLKWATVEV